MHELYELKDKLCEELEKYGTEELTAGSLEVVDKLAHTIKNLHKIIEKYEEDEYSGAMGGSYARGGSYTRGGNRGGQSYTMGGSYARGGRRGANQYGSYAREGGYSRNEGMIAELYELMEQAPDEKTKKEFERFVKKIEMM